jgi:hypothetical protein
MISFNRQDGGDDNLVGVFTYPQQMRIAPTIKIFNPGGTTPDGFWDQRRNQVMLRSILAQETISERHANFTYQNGWQGAMICGHFSINAEF